MKNSTIFIGLDVHKDFIAVAHAQHGQKVMEERQIINESQSIRRLVGRLARHQKPLSFFYEAGPCGYGLYRQIHQLGSSCSVVAPSKIPRCPGDRVKTDRRDAKMLARLARSGDLVSVWVPGQQHEAIRDLVRCRCDFVDQSRRIRQQINSMMLRHQRPWGRDKWTQAHRRWLAEQKFSHSQLQVTLDHYLAGLESVEQQITVIERQMLESLQGWELKPLVDGLMAMRGVKLITGMSIVAELGDMSRFSRPESLMSFVGLVPSEHSSGTHRFRGGITRTGNSQVRSLLVESAWSARHRPNVSKALAERSRWASTAVREIAFAAQQRLHRRFHRLLRRGKNSKQSVTAVAREKIGFFWAIAMQVAKEQSQLKIPFAGHLLEYEIENNFNMVTA